MTVQLLCLGGLAQELAESKPGVESLCGELNPRSVADSEACHVVHLGIVSICGRRVGLASPSGRALSLPYAATLAAICRLATNFSALFVLPRGRPVRSASGVPAALRHDDPHQRRASSSSSMLLRSTNLPTGSASWCRRACDPPRTAKPTAAGHRRPNAVESGSGPITVSPERVPPP